MKTQQKKKYNIATKKGVYTVKIWFDKQGKAYLVQCVSLPEVVTFGKTLKEAKRMAKEAIELYCDCLIEQNKIIVDDVGMAFGKMPKIKIFSMAR